MAKKRKVTFDPKVFLATVDGGRTIAKYQKAQIIFDQGSARSRPPKRVGG